MKPAQSSDRPSIFASDEQRRLLEELMATRNAQKAEETLRELDAKETPLTQGEATLKNLCESIRRQAKDITG